MKNGKSVKRSWLNDQEDMMGAIISSSELSDGGSKEKFFHWGCIEIRDCSRKVSLDFHVADKKSKKAALKKLKLLKSHIKHMESEIKALDPSRVR